VSFFFGFFGFEVPALCPFFEIDENLSNLREIVMFFSHDFEKITSIRYFMSDDPKRSMI